MFGPREGDEVCSAPEGGKVICSASSMSEGVECSTPSVRGVVLCLEIEIKRTKFRGKRS